MLKSIQKCIIVENNSGEVYIVENEHISRENKLIANEIAAQFESTEIKNEIEAATEEEIPLPEFIDTDQCSPAKNEIHYKNSFDESWSSSESENEAIITQSKPKSIQQSNSLSCKYCEKKFVTKNEQWMHICEYLCDNPENYICRVCHRELSKKSFNTHVHESFNCNYCEETFFSSSSLKAHIANVHKSESYVPPKKRNMEEYLKQSEGSNKGIKKLSPINQLLRRKGVRTKVKYPRKKQRFECDLCGKYLVSLRSLQFHMNLHRGDSSYICASCGLQFYTPNGIKGHSCEKKRRRPEKDFRTYDMRYCRFCDQHFASLDENKAHKCEFQNPDDPKSVFCRCCGKVLAKLAFNRHWETHSGVDWICGICNRKLATERALKTHLTTHSGNKPYKCTLCPESFINKVVLERHMRFHGQTPKLYRCEFCFKQLSTETSLKSHLQRLHKNSVQCELCKEEFINREYLKEHLQTMHEPSVCKVCGKSFALPRYLRMHEKLHFQDSTQKQPCQICSKELSMKNIKHHVYRHHQELFDEWCKANPSY